MSTPRHDTSSRRQDLLYDPSIPTPSHAERARTLVARDAQATLATALDEGHPYASVVLYAVHEGSPVLLISGLATHTKNLHRDPRCTLLVREADADNPLALGRVSLVGEAAITEDAAAREAFLARHPDAARYADFGDFAFWAIDVRRLRYIGGFGRMSWVDGEDWSRARPDPLDDAAAGILAHMNEDHPDALRVYCEAFSKAGAVQEATMTAVDRYGFELSAVTDDGPRPIRVAFSEEVATPDEVRQQMVALVREGRARLSEE